MQTENENKVIVFDLDGTLANDNHRNHWLQMRPKRWTEYFKECHKDLPNTQVIKICNQLYRLGYWVVILTGRSDEVKYQTEKWLMQNNVHHSELIMRPEGLWIEDIEFKKDAIASYMHRIQWAFDDRNRSVKMWRELGITCFQVAEGDF